MKNRETIRNVFKLRFFITLGGIMKSSALIVAEANDFLDKLPQPSSEKDAEKAVHALSNLKEDMLISGFSATFPEMLISVSKEFDEGQSDLPKQLKIFREFANMKRYALNRVRISLAAHRILLNMMKRGHNYDIAQCLPYNGAHLHQLIYLGEPAIRAYNSLQRIMSIQGNQEDAYIATLQHNNKKVNFVIQSNQNLEEKIKRIYGPDAVLVEVKKKKTAPPLVMKRSSRTAIATAYAALAAQKVYSEKNDGSLKAEHTAYAEAISKYGLSSDARLDAMEGEGFEDIKDQLYSKGLMIYENESLQLAPEVLSQISKRRARYNSTIVKDAEKRFAADIFHFLMAEPKRVRSSLPIFPGISSDMNEEQFSFLSLVSEDAVGLVRKKLELETSGPNLPGKVLGATLLYLAGKHNWREDFGVSESEVLKAANTLSPYLSKGTSDQAKKFMELTKE